MSTFVREKVLRIPYENTGWQHRFSDPEDAKEYCEANFSNLFGYGKVGKFQFSPTERTFIDFVIDCIITQDRLPIHTSGTNPKCILLCINQLQEVHEAKHSLCSVLSQRLSQPL